MEKIYIVMGQTGEYSDRVEWPVAAFRNESGACERVAALDTWLRERRCHYDDNNRYAITWSEREAIGNPTLDPNFQHDYTGTKYYVMAVDIAD